MTRALAARKRKIFALFFALAASIGLSWATTVTWDNSTLSSIYMHDGESFTKDGVTVMSLDGMIDGQRGSWMGNSVDASFKFSTSLGNFTRIEITGGIRRLGGSGWTEASPGAVWTGDANETTFGMYFRDVTQIVFTIENAAPAIAKTITDNGMTYDIYDNGVVKVSGTGIVAARIFAANDHDYVPSVKRFEFADDCKVYSFGEDWYMYYTSYSPLEAVDIKTTLPFVAGRESVFYRKEDGSDESVTVTITAPAIASINREFVANYGTPQHIIFNMPVTTFEKNWCSYLREKDTVTIPTGSLYHLPASYAFKDEYLQYRYDDMVAYGDEDMFWKYEASGLVEGVDYTRTEEKTGVITAENDSVVFGKAVVKYQVPQEAPATSWTFWRSDDFKTFPELENGSSHTCKDVTMKIVDGSSTIINMSGSYITLSTSATNGIQLIAPKGKIFKQVIALDRDLRTSLIWTGEADTVGISSNLMQISLIEFELDAAPASVTLPEAVAGLVYNGEAQTLIAAGEAAGFTFQYKVGENGEYSADLPTATDAGSYTVYYKATAEGKEDITGSVEVSIAKAALTITAENKEVVYGLAAPGFSVSYYGLKGSDLPANVLTGELSYACDYTVGSNVASYDIVPSGQTSANYDITYVKGTLVVYKADPAFTEPVANTLTYNGGAQTLIAAGTTEHGTFEYTFTPNDEESWNTALPQAKNADTYGVYYRVVGDANHNDYESADAVVVTIAKAALTATADDKSVIYGDDAPEYTVTYEGWQGEDNADVLSGTIAYACEYAPTSNVGDYTIVPSGVSNPDYAITFVNGKVTVSKAALTITADNKSVIYGDEAPAFTASYEGFKNEDDETVVSGLTLTSEYVLTSNVGEYDIVPANATATNYAITFVNGTLTVNKAALTITAENKEVVYGYAAPGFSVSYYGLKGSDLPADVLTGELSYACDYTVGSNVASYDIVPSGQTSANYDITYVKGTLVVYKADPAFTEPVANTLTYNGGAQTLIAAGTTEHGTFEYTFTPNDEESWNTALPQAKNADTYGVYYRVVGDANHNDYESADAVVVTIAKAALTATADDKSVIYGDDAPEYTVTYEGWQGEDNADVLSGTIAYACEYAPTSNVGDYTIVPSGVSNPDYAITFVNGKVTVSKAALTITADNKSVIYGDEAPAFTASYEGFKNEDDASVVSGLTLTSEYVQTSNVGEYAIVPADATAQNYAISYTNGTLTVNRAALMITADNKEVTYGDEAPAFTASYEGFKNEDDETVVSGLTLTSEYVLTSNVGEYDIVPADATAQNYAISYTKGTLTVNQAPLMITADDKSVIYGDEHPEFTASYSGWKNTDDKSVVSGLTLTSEYVLTSNVGEYDIVPADATATNYAISYTNGTLTVNPAALTITAEDKVMIYGDEHPEFTVTYEGFKNEDDESVVSGLQFSTPYAPGSYIGTYAINPNSATALNYAITFVDGTLTVNKAHVYVSAAEAQIAKFADGHANAVVLEQGVLNGIKLNDPIAHVTTAAFSSADVAENLTITLFYELTGDAALLNNYNLDPTSEIFTTEGVIIEPFIPDNEEKPEDEEATVDEGIEIYAYGYCDGSGYSLKYHLESGNPDQYKIDFADSRFTDVDWTNLEITGKDGTIDIDIPVDLPTGDYTMTVYFRDSRFDWLESRQFNVTFHVNLPETYVRPLFDNVIALVDTCHCLTDIQWYWRANSSEPWQPIEGANGYYYHADGKLTGEYFVSAKMNGEPTYTCGQTDMETLYGAGQQAQAPVVRAYPNPVVNTTIVTIENSDNFEHNLRVVNLMGAEVMSTTFEGNETNVEMSGYPQGNYMISVDGIVVKVMKQ